MTGREGVFKCGRGKCVPVSLLTGDSTRSLPWAARLLWCCTHAPSREHTLHESYLIIYINESRTSAADHTHNIASGRHQNNGTVCCFCTRSCCNTRPAPTQPSHLCTRSLTRVWDRQACVYSPSKAAFSFVYNKCVCVCLRPTRQTSQADLQLRPLCLVKVKGL